MLGIWSVFSTEEDFFAGKGAWKPPLPKNTRYRQIPLFVIKEAVGTLEGIYTVHIDEEL